MGSRISGQVMQWPPPRPRPSPAPEIVITSTPAEKGLFGLVAAGAKVGVYALVTGIIAV
jgi:hypothetical protein